ncbi:DUF262 domain-containing protein [Hyphomicrobium sp. B1]|uniref:DUF262 domain-containing protein n=1 Tax=Hyphomicrobium sp. B1 TaxID=3075651 RepID=UPI003C2B28B7
MDAKDHKVIAILGDQRRFIVPVYQRQYQWQTQRLQPFWDDVVAKAQEALDGKPKFSHYMGALILAPGSDGYIIGATPRVQVVDGQQRLTTFQIFLAAIREASAKLGFPDIAKSVHDYIFNRPMSGDSEKDATYKLVPTRDDRAIFQELMKDGLQKVRQTHPSFFFKNGNVIQNNAPNTVRAMAFFIDKIIRFVGTGLANEEDFDILDDRSFADEDSGVKLSRLQALLEALLNHLKVVVITLEDTDDAQVIFETLNSQAEPLLAMDLVRNNIFHRATAQGESTEELFERKWQQFDSPFWKADSPRAKPKRPRIDHFLSHALSAQTGNEISLRELYAEYRAFTRPKGKLRFATVETELDALLKFVPTYVALEQGDGGGDLEILGEKLRTWEVTTAYPFVFAVAASDADDEEKSRIYRLIYSYLVRRAVCGLTPKNLNKTFQRLVTSMAETGVSVQAFASAFADQTGPTVRFPSDIEFRNAIRTSPVYLQFARKDRLADILWELELASRTKYTVKTGRPDSMSIEHVLPQTWMTNWKLPDGRACPADKVGLDKEMVAAISSREGLLHTLGNLTLITVPGNTAASNSAFKEKAPWLKQSLLALNLDILDQTSWDEVEIRNRADRLADLAVKVWAYPAP